MKGSLRLGQLATRNNLMVTQQRNLTAPDWVRKYMYNLSGWNQYGLYKDDLMVENEDVQEAIRRLPPTMQVIFNLIQGVTVNVHFVHFVLLVFLTGRKGIQNSTCHSVITYEDGFT